LSVVRAGSEPDDLLESCTMTTDGAAAARAEWRAEEAAWTRAAFEQWEHGRSLADVVRDAMHRGDQVSFAHATVTWAGTPLAVGDDIVRVDVGDGSVDVRLAPAAPFVLRMWPSAGAGRRGRETVTTFLARLRELDGTSVRVGAPATELEGELRVGRDQLRLVDRDGRCAYVPIESSWWVRAVDDD
jgi:hypothetical protein